MGCILNKLWAEFYFKMNYWLHLNKLWDAFMANFFKNELWDIVLEYY